MKITKQRLKEIIKEELSPELVDVAVLAARNNDLDAFEKNVLELLEIGINDPRASQITRISGELMEKVHDADLSHEALGKQLLKLKLIPDLQRMLSRLSENKPTMKITKQRLKEIIKEELSTEGTWRDAMEKLHPGHPSGNKPSCENPEEDLDFIGILDAAILAVGDRELASQLDCLKQRIVPQSEYDEEDDPGDEAFRRAARLGAPKKQGDPVGFQETIRQMVREALGAPQPRKYSFKEGSWAVRRPGTAEYLVQTRNGLDWGPKEKALTQLFEPEAWGIRKAAELGQSATSILDGIEHADIVDLSEPEEPEESGDKGRLLPKVDRAMIDRLQKGLQTGDWGK